MNTKEFKKLIHCCTRIEQCTDTERLLYAWSACYEFPSFEEKISMLSNMLTTTQFASIADAARVFLSNEEEDFLGFASSPMALCNPKSKDYVPKEFIVALSNSKKILKNGTSEICESDL